jgi:hypothetical protein
MWTACPSYSSGNIMPPSGIHIHFHENMVGERPPWKLTLNSEVRHNFTGPLIMSGNACGYCAFLLLMLPVPHSKFLASRKNVQFSESRSSYSRCECFELLSTRFKGLPASPHFHYLAATHNYLHFHCGSTWQAMCKAHFTHTRD